eukprot:353839-Chlamydomonas_euryale.AAC.29
MGGLFARKAICSSCVGRALVMRQWAWVGSHERHGFWHGSFYRIAKQTKPTWCSDKPMHAWTCNASTISLAMNVVSTSLVIVKAVRHFATTADEKARRGAERVVKAVGGGSTSDDADRKPATHSLAEVKHASESDAPGLPRSSSLASDERKLAAAGELAPLLLEVAKAEQHCSYVVSRGNNVKAVRKITVHGSCV